jgi:DNA-binding NarL/FixJ family response regulator
MKRMFIVGEERFVVHAMRLALRHANGVTLYGVIDGERDVRRAAREAAPDIVLVDGSAGATATQRVREIREETPSALIVFLAPHADAEGLDDILEAGAILCLSRSAAMDQLASLLRAAPEERPAEATAPEPLDEQPSPLTARELEILRSVAEGHTNARIGRELWVTEQTVKFHLSNIYRKLGVSNRTEASRYALVNRLFDRPAAGRRPTLPAATAGEHINGSAEGVARTAAARLQMTGIR